MFGLTLPWAPSMSAHRTCSDSFRKSHCPKPSDCDRPVTRAKTGPRTLIAAALEDDMQPSAATGQQKRHTSLHFLRSAVSDSGSFGVAPTVSRHADTAQPSSHIISARPGLQQTRNRTKIASDSLKSEGSERKAGLVLARLFGHRTLALFLGQRQDQALHHDSEIALLTGIVLLDGICLCLPILSAIVSDMGCV